MTERYECSNVDGHEWKTNERGRKSCKHCKLLYVFSQDYADEIAKEFVEATTCTCDEMERRDLHQCPWEVEVEGNEDEKHCNCCPACTEECFQNT